VAQGWEILNYATSHDGASGVVENFLLRKQKAHRILSLRPKLVGKGYVVVKEMDI
jgi:hypothetical protein